MAVVSHLELKAKLFRGFADSSRLAVLEALRAGPLSVSAIVEATGLSQSNTSNHLSCLHDCGLVTRTQQGRFVVYALSDPRVAETLALAGGLLGDIAERIYACTHYGAARARPGPTKRTTTPSARSARQKRAG